jgi:hypothetical protein
MLHLIHHPLGYAVVWQVYGNIAVQTSVNTANAAGRKYQQMLLLSIVYAEGFKDVAIWAE